MFTGLVEEIGTIRSVSHSSDYQELWVNAHRVLDDLRRGDSISINGACQTVTALDDNGFAVETLGESLKKTTLGSGGRGTELNLERAVTPSTRLGGHLVQGHVDGVARVSQVRRQGANIYFEVIVLEHLARYCISEGSVALDGVSLTIAQLRGTRLVINIIPTTWNDTALRNRRAGSYVNVEVDVMARYAERLLSSGEPMRGRSGGGDRTASTPGTTSPISGGRS